jgi:hypothetical protein
MCTYQYHNCGHLHVTDMTSTIEQKDTTLFLAYPGHIRRIIVFGYNQWYTIICIFRLSLIMHNNEFDAITEKTICDFRDGDGDECHYHQGEH